MVEKRGLTQGFILLFIEHKCLLGVFYMQEMCLAL